MASEASIAHTPILAVDDDPLVLAALQRLLSGERIDLLTASNPKKALQLLETMVPRLVLLDVGMPDQDGLALCRQLKQDPRLTDLPVIMMSGRISSADVELGIAAGAVDYIKKPFDYDEFRFRVRAQLRLREMQQQRDKERVRLLAITSAARDAIVQINSRDEITLWNEAAASLFGYGTDEALGQRLHRLITPERFLKQHEDAFPDFCRTGLGDAIGKTLELVARNKAGDEFPIELSLSAVMLNGEWHAVGICRDISQRRQAELQLQRSEARFRTSFENASVGQALADPGGKFTALNRKFCRMLGYTEAELLGKTFVELTHPDDLEQSLQVRRDLVDGRLQLSRLEKRYFKKDGAAVWADVSVTVTRDAEGNVLQFNTHAIDITDRKYAEEGKTRSETRFRTLYEASLDAVMLLDAGGYFDCNQAAVQMFGCKSKEEFYARHPAEFSPEVQPCGADSLTLADSRIRKAVEDGSNRFEWVHRRVDSGEDFPAEVLLSRMTLDGRVVLQATVRDISERKRAEVALRTEVAHRQQMELELRQAHKLEAVGQLAAGIAHEINTPSQWVSDNVAFLKKAFESFATVLEAAVAAADECSSAGVQLPSIDRFRQAMTRSKLDRVIGEMPRALAQAQEGLRRISSIVMAMKEFAHPSTGRKQPMDVNAALNTTVTVARNEWKYVADIVFDLAPDLPAVPALKDELNQAFLNLIVNAAHAVGEAIRPGPTEKGKITLTTRVTGPWLEVRIGDTGPGIPPAVCARIFEPFFTTKPVGKGTGQGLAIARSVVVDKHRGKLFFETEVGRGTTFIVQLPLGDAATNHSEPAS